MPRKHRGLDPHVRELLMGVSTATLCTQMLRRGFRTPFMEGPSALNDRKLVGTALTLRYAPAREDVGISDHFDNDRNLQRVAVESIGAGDVLVVDARGQLGAGTLGNILATRIAARGGAGIVTDGSVRDRAGVAAAGIAAFAAGANARLSSTIHHPVDIDVPIGCGGVLVLPGDVVVGDADGVIVLPAALAREVAEAATEQERLELFTLEAVASGRPLAGVYPAESAFLDEYRAAADSETSA